MVEIIIIAIGLAMDAFAVSICKGINIKNEIFKKGIIVGLYFGIFQALMPLFGYFLGNQFISYIENYDHYIIFAILGIIGINMIKESFNDEEGNVNDRLDFKTMFLLAIATSIDALAVGFTLALMKTSIFASCIIIGIITFIICFIGVYLGNKFGNRYQNKATLLGGIILILIGLKILLEHLGII